MYLMYADETDHHQEGAAPFFLYGAVFIPADVATDLSNFVAVTRTAAGFRPGDIFKFASAGLPIHVTRQAHTHAKREVVRYAGELGVTFSVNVVLHALARTRPHDTLVEWGANTMLGAFNTFLRERVDTGLAFLDRLPIAGSDDYIKERFGCGLDIAPRSGRPGSRQPLDRILGIHPSIQGASHFASVADVVLGSFRYCVNELERDQAPRQILPPLVRMMWRTTHRPQQPTVRDARIIIRPMRIDNDELREQYDTLIRRLDAFLAPGDGA